jgi:hypothetical protein
LRTEGGKGKTLGGRFLACDVVERPNLLIELLGGPEKMTRGLILKEKSANGEGKPEQLYLNPLPLWRMIGR